MLEHLEKAEEEPLGPGRVIGTGRIGRCVERSPSCDKIQPDHDCHHDGKERDVLECLRRPVGFGGPALRSWGRCQTVAASKRHMGPEAKDHQDGQDGHVQAEKASDRLVAIFGAANHDRLESRPHDRSPAHDVGHDLGRPVALLVPGKLVASVSEGYGQHQKGQSEPPVDFARLAVRSCDQHLKQVQD